MSHLKGKGFNVVAAAIGIGVGRVTMDQLYPWMEGRVGALAAGGQLPSAAYRVADVFKWAGYDLSSDHVMTKAFLSGLVAYLFMGVFVCTLMDMLPGIFLRFKTQGSRSYFTVGEWLEATGVSLFNMCVLGWIVSIPNWRLRHYLWAPIIDESDPWVWQHELPKLLGCVLIVDFWFYSTHRLIHHPKLYKALHKFHHRFTAPTAVACMYATAPEYLIGNLAGVALGPTLTNAHPITTYCWVAFALVSTCGSHSGYKFMSAAAHDAHHEFFNYNYGVGGFMDLVFGTRYEGSKLWHRHQAAKAAKATAGSKPAADTPSTQSVDTTASKKEL